MRLLKALNQSSAGRAIAPALNTPGKFVIAGPVQPLSVTLRSGGTIHYDACVYRYVSLTGPVGIPVGDWPVEDVESLGVADRWEPLSNEEVQRSQMNAPHVSV